MEGFKIDLKTFSGLHGYVKPILPKCQKVNIKLVLG